MIQTNIDNSEPIKQKRGRKSKKELLILSEKQILKDNISCFIEETIEKGTFLNCESNENNELIESNDLLDADETPDIQKTVAKKRGRKPKGGKIIQQIVPLNNNIETKPNVILHLKCSLKDLQTNTLLSSNIESYNFASNKGDLSLSYEIINSNKNNDFKENTLSENDNKYYEEDCVSINYDENYSKETETKEIWKKLKQLEHNLHVNNISDKKSACFWCTYEFDNPPVYIPKHYIKETYHVYGCYCSPECATAFLMEENIDSSTKFERYYLINHIYAKIYNFNKNIKPAPNPYYMLDKYYGNLTIQEYRALLRNERLFLIVDKPLTRILPELHEDNDEFIINNKIIPSNTYQIKKKNQSKSQNKNSIFNDKFGTTQ